MPTTPIDIVTVSREYGSGGAELAHAIGAALGWPVLDQDLAQRVAVRLGFDPDVVERLDEQPPTLLARLGAALFVLPPEAPVHADTSHLPTTDAIASAVSAEIRSAARTPPLVVVGHGGQCLLCGRPGTLHLRVVAPIESRVERLRARYGWDAARATSTAHRADTDRREYVRRYHRRDIREESLYDLVINTGTVPIPAAAAFVAALVHAGQNVTASRAGAPEAIPSA